MLLLLLEQILVLFVRVSTTGVVGIDVVVAGNGGNSVEGWGGDGERR